jgi:hypothetical protein
MYITESDIFEASKKYPNIPFVPIGQIVDIRTYRRWLPGKKRRETALERNARVVNYNVSLVKDLLSEEELREEALLMFDKMNQLKADASGRTKWVGGTECTEKNPEANMNCSAMALS